MWAEAQALSQDTGVTLQVTCHRCTWPSLHVENTTVDVWFIG